MAGFPTSALDVWAGYKVAAEKTISMNGCGLH